MDYELPKKFDEKLKNRFSNTYKFYNYDVNIFILLLQKGVYPHEYMDDWERFSETSLPDKEDFSASQWTWKILVMQITHTQREFIKAFIQFFFSLLLKSYNIN